MRALVLVGLAMLALVAAFGFWTEHAPEPAPEPDTAKRKVARDPGPEHTAAGDAAPREVHEADTPIPTPPAEPQPETGRLEVSVVWNSGEPAAGVVLRLLPSGEAWDTRTLTTDDVGHARRDLEPGDFVVRSVAGAERAATIRAGETTRVRLKLPAGAAFDILVVDPDELPIAGAEVWLSERWQSNRSGLAAKTDGHGRAVLRDVSPKCYVSARAPGYEPSESIPTAQPPSAGPLRIMLRRGGGAAHGVVVDPSGAPIRGALVLVGEEKVSIGARTQQGTFKRNAAPCLVRTDARGRFVARPVASGVQPVRIRRGGFAPLTATIEARPGGGGAPQRFVLTEGATVAGTARLADGTPVAFTRVATTRHPEFLTRSTSASLLGKYVLRDLAPGEQELVATRRREQTRTTLNLVAGRTHEWNPVLDDQPAKEGTFRLRGKVVDPKNEPLARVTVLVTSEPPDGRTQTTSTDKEGEFRVDLAWPVARITVSTAGAYRELPDAILEGVRVEDGDVLIRVEPAASSKAEVRGTVVDGNGRPVAAKLRFWHVDRRIWRSYGTDPESGAFSIRKIPPGKVSLKITSDAHPWLQLPEVTVAAGETRDLGRIALQGGGTLRGTLRFTDRSVAADARVRVSLPTGMEACAVTCAGGKFRSGPLAAGSYRLHVAGDRVARQTREVTVREGHETELRIELERAALRVFVLQLPEGAPRPSFLTIQLRDAKQRLFWDVGLNPRARTTIRVSAPPGSYRLRVYDDKIRMRLDHAVEISTLEDAPAEALTIDR